MAGGMGLLVTHRDAVGVLLPDALGLSLALLERVLVLELGAHVGGCVLVDGGGLRLLDGNSVGSRAEVDVLLVGGWMKMKT